MTKSPALPSVRDKAEVDESPFADALADGADEEHFIERGVIVNAAASGLRTTG